MDTGVGVAFVDLHLAVVARVAIVTQTFVRLPVVERPARTAVFALTRVRRVLAVTSTEAIHAHTLERTIFVLKRERSKLLAFSMAMARLAELYCHT